MKLLDKHKIREWDQYSIEGLGMESLELMEKASSHFVQWFTSLYFDKCRLITVVAGPGNNGGDGLAVARMLMNKGYAVQVHYMAFSESPSKDNAANLERLGTVCYYRSFTKILCPPSAIIIDALLGTGIKGPARGEYLKVIQFLNQSDHEIVSIDIPSGLDPDGHEEGEYIKSQRVLSFEIPKISFFTENIPWSCKSIGLVPDFLEKQEVKYELITREMVQKGMRIRYSDQGKHHFGFGQFCGGSPGMLGSVILASRAAMRCGLGRLSVSIPKLHHGAFLASCPEVMVQSGIEANRRKLSAFQFINKGIDAIAIGPGLGTSASAIKYIDEFLDEGFQQTILDADALNIIAREEWQDRIPEDAIITPHEQEFERLFGPCERRLNRIELQRAKSEELGIYIILKGAHTCISTPEGMCYFNNTGNVGLGTAGSGDVLSGMLLGFLGQNYAPLQAAISAVYLHGLAGDHAKLKFGEVSLIASDIIDYIPEVIKNVYEK
ncbi:NAD(P)H-hydrate dehydratase [Portibacter marinus]|uniref:NAD(P)H-hydrate dehydratase n=1 Tax=Portibacter marinus TaxID=2898660 RepID=UPI001F2C68C1|nr:NAD(P)H-hydrate dehydratase [Portibacter marinus]